MGSTVWVHLYSQSEPIVIDDVRNTYTKDGLYCVMAESGTVWKYPVQHIFRVREELTRG